MKLTQKERSAVKLLAAERLKAMHPMARGMWKYMVLIRAAREVAGAK